MSKPKFCAWIIDATKQKTCSDLAARGIYCDYHEKIWVAIKNSKKEG